MSSQIRLQICLLLALIGQIQGTAHYVKLHLSNDGGRTCTYLTEETIQRYRGFKKSADASQIRIFTKDATTLPANSGQSFSKNLDTSKIIEIYGQSKPYVDAYIDTICSKIKQVEPLVFSPKLRAPEILQIVDNGDKSNRIDVVFMGDGYNASERTKFFEDMERLTKDMFEGETFSSYLPVFNIWAIYVESVDSGIGYNGPKNTPFKLYRQAGQLRGIFPGNSSYARQVCLLTGLSGCDYPSLIANDDYYGGLGGEFVISTKSHRTGTVVLRHEMGHNFIDVGEEYDGGSVYSGVNSARSLNTLGWTSWLTGEVREERVMYRLLEYPWHDLSSGEKSFPFSSDGAYDNWYLQVSVSAAGDEGSLEFELDGEIVPWETRGSDDREFYDWFGQEGFTSGSHTFTVRSKTTPTNPDIPRMIASITIHEYGTAEEFNHSPEHVSAYPTWDTGNRKTYRPTNEGCSMRNMTSPVFCPVCKEGMWMQFFQRISIIDSVEIDNTVSPANVTVHTLKLGQLRDPARNIKIAGEEMKVKWYRNGFEQLPLRDLFTIGAMEGDWVVEVQFVTPEVRDDPDFLLVESQSFTVNPQN